MGHCASQAPSGTLGRLAHLLTQSAYNTAKGLLASQDINAWIGMKTTVANSVNWNDWDWYNDANTVAGPVTFVPSDPADIGENGQDCGFMSYMTPGFRDFTCSSGSPYLCEFYCRKYMLVSCVDARMITDIQCGSFHSNST